MAPVAAALLGERRFLHQVPVEEWNQVERSRSCWEEPARVAGLFTGGPAKQGGVFGPDGRRGRARRPLFMGRSFAWIRRRRRVDAGPTPQEAGGRAEQVEVRGRDDETLQGKGAEEEILASQGPWNFLGWST